ncbi:hypothetical protein O3P69_007023 [Scylla paramamosain]|uniref:Uncharacterized protein n=1 Tax=Scylla paramamosain TaxID=85552 RepID=A0AAW0V3N2_SCYPA
MNNRVKHILKYVCAAATLCLVVVVVCPIFSASVNDHQQWLNITLPGSASCRALFTVTDVPQRYAPNASLFVHNRYGYVSADKLSVDWRARQHPDTCGGNDVAGAVQQLLLKRDSPSGAATTDYSPLAAVLPSVLAFQGEGEASAPTVTATTRIGAAGGLLPYVPCEIATYADPASVAACFRARLAHQDTLWIFFMGDSKIRYLFFEFLARSDDELHYLVKLPNAATPFATMERERVKLKVDMEASSTLLPGLLVSFQFRTFSEQQVSKMRGSAEVKQLARWAAGQETPPHLLVLGYAAWATRKMEAYLCDALSFLADMHQIVATLLQQISQRARVVVTSQNRYKVKTSAAPHESSIPLGDPTFDWSEAMFLYHVRRYSLHRPPSPAFGTRAGIPKFPARIIKARLDNNSQRHRDHLVPEVEESRVWWWDTSLPLSLAENRECEELYLRGLTSHPVYNSSFHRCYDDNHAGTVTLGDQVTMLLNLACNSVLGAREGVCCS